MHLYNPTPLTIYGHYAGIKFVFPPETKTRIKSIRQREEVLVAEDIAAKLYADLSPRGLILIDDETPIDDDEAKLLGRSALKSFIQQMIDDFNDLNAEQASKGAPIFAIPRHYKELQKLLKQMKAEDGTEEDTPPDFTSREDLDDMRQRGEISREQALKTVMQALETGDAETVLKAATAAKQLIDGGQAQEGEFTVRTAAGKGQARRGRPASGRAGVKAG